ncbi:non-structural maintenance of chromosomes element 3 homolog [Anopheles cruzii]|uniref:non-structural maintenance of chromosomes element 3 homolog n=1 Tax=Anopheles cruzii TaxID=68878 RepID=UPI0022EC3BA6|nr:non-structural maintenance of chromosomes element 3 homolog [Anopheles cruzii]
MPPRRPQSQSQSQLQTSQENQSSSPDSQATQNNTHLINQLVKAILNLSCNKAIMKRADIIKMALKGNGRMFGKLFNEVNDLLKEVYGYELIEVDKNKNLILCSTIAPASMFDLNENYRKSYTFLYLILGYIFMKSGSVPETLLWEFLQKVGIVRGEDHPYYGEPEKLFETFLKQAYLARTKQTIESFNDDFICITWGVRAQHEVSKKQVLDSLCTTMNRNPMDFKSQYIEAEGLVSPPLPESTSFSEYVGGSDFVEEHVETVQNTVEMLEDSAQFFGDDEAIEASEASESNENL